jgi:glycosyltransferase involved in cell wall biosynthesis
MRVALVFHKNPFASPASIDLIRLRAISSGLHKRGIDTDIVAPVPNHDILDNNIKVFGPERLYDPLAYDIVKTCYHNSIRLVPPSQKIVVSRIVRVVDTKFPERDQKFRSSLLECQEMIRERASAVIFNNIENRSRWTRLYGESAETELVPTGCPSVTPAQGQTPYITSKKILLFLGSLAATRMAQIMNELAERVSDVAEIHMVGLNKTAMYGAGSELSPLIVNHGEKTELETWDYIYNAHVGLAFATGPLPFDNDISKIYSYLRGGLPTLSEKPILNNKLVEDLGYGSTFGYGDMEELVSCCKRLLANPPLEKREQVMRTMVRDHSWDERVKRYVKLFKKLMKRKLYRSMSQDAI